MADSSAECIANIGPQERRKRLVFGIAALAVSVVISFLFVLNGVQPVLRLPLFIPLFVGALGFYQARDRTWVRLASRGQRDMDAGPQPIADAAEAAQVQRQAKKIYLKSFISAAILTALALLQ
jgi:hypothetical protein